MNGKKRLLRDGCFAMGLTFVLLAGACSVVGQEIRLDYFPKKNVNVTVTDYKKGRYILENTYRSIRGHEGKPVYADYWNVGVAYSYMGVNHDSTLGMFRKSKQVNESSFSQIVAHSMRDKDAMENRLVKLLGQPFLEIIKDCNLELKPTTLAKRMEEKDALDLEGLNESLIDELLVLMDKDQRYRYSSTAYKGNWNEQNKLDMEVQLAIAELFDKNGYPGSSAVGAKFSGHACLMLEHGGELAHQEKYYPLVKDAYVKGEVPESCFLMLIDRIHWKKTKKQIFGSHAGVPFDSDEVIKKIKDDIGWNNGNFQNSKVVGDNS